MVYLPCTWENRKFRLEIEIKWFSLFCLGSFRKYVCVNQNSRFVQILIIPEPFQSWIFDKFILDRIDRELHSLERLELKFGLSSVFFVKIPVKAGFH